MHVACQACGGTSSGLVIDDVEGYAERACRACDERTVMLDSADAAAEADAGEAARPCGGEVFNLAVGYAFFAGEDEVRWGCTCPLGASSTELLASTPNGRSTIPRRCTCSTGPSRVR